MKELRLQPKGAPKSESIIIKKGYERINKMDRDPQPVAFITYYDSLTGPVTRTISRRDVMRMIGFLDLVVRD